jgi:hypothetical protein
MNVGPFLHNETLIWTLTTSGYKFYTLNLVRHLQAAKVPWKLAVICADKPVYRFFRNEGIPCILYEKAQGDSTGQMLLFGSKPFQEINLVKLDILATFAARPEIKTCIYLDGDVVVTRDFVPDIVTRLEETPLLFQCDEQRRDPCTRPCKNCCTGLIAFLHGHDGGIFKVTDRPTWLQAPEDQRWVNTQLQIKQIPYDTLQRDLYPNGVFSEGWKTECPQFSILHYNWLVGPSKLARMKKNGHWILPYM